MRNACAWPLASTRIAERPVTTALGPITRTSRASGVIDAYPQGAATHSCSNSARVVLGTVSVGVGEVGGEEMRERAGIGLHQARTVDPQ